MDIDFTILKKRGLLKESEEINTDVDFRSSYPSSAYPSSSQSNSSSSSASPFDFLGSLAGSSSDPSSTSSPSSSFQSSSSAYPSSSSSYPSSNSNHSNIPEISEIKIKRLGKYPPSIFCHERLQ